MQRETKQFRAQVVYAIPAMDELKRRFLSGVYSDYEGINFKPIKACENVSREAREVAFELVHLGYKASNDAVLAEMEKRGLRPALPEELLAFDAKYPKMMKKFQMVALGSEADIGGDRRVALLFYDDDGRYLYLDWIISDWGSRLRFLAVRE